MLKFFGRLVGNDFSQRGGADPFIRKAPRNLLFGAVAVALPAALLADNVGFLDVPVLRVFTKSSDDKMRVLAKASRVKEEIDVREYMEGKKNELYTFVREPRLESHRGKVWVLKEDAALRKVHNDALKEFDLMDMDAARKESLRKYKEFMAKTYGLAHNRSALDGPATPELPHVTVNGVRADPGTFNMLHERMANPNRRPDGGVFVPEADDDLVQLQDPDNRFFYPPALDMLGIERKHIPAKDRIARRLVNKTAGPVELDLMENWEVRDQMIQEEDDFFDLESLREGLSSFTTASIEDIPQNDSGKLAREVKQSMVQLRKTLKNSWNLEQEGKLLAEQMADEARAPTSLTAREVFEFNTLQDLFHEHVRKSLGLDASTEVTDKHIIEVARREGVPVDAFLARASRIQRALERGTLGGADLFKSGPEEKGALEFPKWMEKFFGAEKQRIFDDRPPGPERPANNLYKRPDGSPLDDHLEDLWDELGSGAIFVNENMTSVDKFLQAREKARLMRTEFNMLACSDPDRYIRRAARMLKEDMPLDDVLAAQAMGTSTYSVRRREVGLDPNDLTNTPPGAKLASYKARQRKREAQAQAEAEARKENEKLAASWPSPPWVREVSGEVDPATLPAEGSGNVSLPSPDDIQQLYRKRSEILSALPAAPAGRSGSSAEVPPVPTNRLLLSMNPEGDKIAYDSISHGSVKSGLFGMLTRPKDSYISGKQSASREKLRRNLEILEDFDNPDSVNKVTAVYPAGPLRAVDAAKPDAAATEVKVDVEALEREAAEQRQFAFEVINLHIDNAWENLSYKKAQLAAERKDWELFRYHYVQFVKENMFKPLPPERTPEGKLVYPTLTREDLRKWELAQYLNLRSLFEDDEGRLRHPDELRPIIDQELRSLDAFMSSNTKGEEGLKEFVKANKFLRLPSEGTTKITPKGIFS